MGRNWCINNVYSVMSLGSTYENMQNVNAQKTGLHLKWCITKAHKQSRETKILESLRKNVNNQKTFRPKSQAIIRTQTLIQGGDKEIIFPNFVP